MSIVETLFALYRHFKYPGRPTGFCQGLSLNWLEAILLSEKSRCIFEDNIKELTHITIEKLILHIAYKSDLKEFVARLFVFQSPQLFLNSYLHGYRN